MQQILLLVFGLLTCFYLGFAVYGMIKLVREVKALRIDVDYVNRELGRAESQIQNDIRKFHEESISYTIQEIKDLDNRLKEISKRLNEIGS
jgi:seryl-tRNA synthetase